MKVLLLPLFTFPTGHSKVSESMSAWMKKKYPHASISERDLLSYCHPTLEKWIAAFYLRWIHLFPHSYGYIYRQAMGKQKKKKRRLYHRLFTTYFIKKMYALIQEEKPDIIICTHSFASKIVALTKTTYPLDVITINVYTDLFINGVWNIDQTDYHFVPTTEARTFIQSNYSVNSERIFITGIPIDPQFTEKQLTKANKRAHVLVAGGNTGLMDVDHLTYLIRTFPQLHFTILCGKNKKLYNDLKHLESPTVQIKPYIQSVKEMDAIYDTVDAMISKPGGVTISEVIHKEIPLYISHYLPGPEEINVSYLLEHEMAACITLDHHSSNGGTDFCQPAALEKMIQQMRKYRASCHHHISEAIDHIICKEKMHEQYVHQRKSEDSTCLPSVRQISG